MAAVCTAVRAPGRLTLDGLVSCVTVVTLTVGSLTPTAAAAAVSWRRCATRGAMPVSRVAATTPPAIPPPSHLIPRRRVAAGAGGGLHPRGWGADGRAPRPTPVTS